MGVNVCLEDSAGCEHPTWDFCRYAGDRDMPRILYALPHTTQRFCDFDERVRPENVAEFVDSMVTAYPECEDRWRELGGILKDEKWWIRFSW